MADDDADAAELAAARSGGARPVADDDTDAAELFAARPVADDNAEGPVARGGDAARSLADDSAEEPVAGGRCEACGQCCR